MSRRNAHGRILPKQRPNVNGPRRGRGMQGLATLAFFLFLFVFFFWSKFIGRHGMAISALFYIWGFYCNYHYRREEERRLRPSPGAAENNGHLGKP